MKNLMDYNLLKAVYFDIDFYTSRMPLLPYFLKFLFNYFSHNFYIIHLIKNLFFSSIIFLLVIKISAKQNFILTMIILFSIFYNPHNLWTSLSFNFEEGILNYLIIILYLLFISDLRHKYLYLAFVISSLFFLKSSMFFLCFFLSVFFLILEFKKNNFGYTPLILLLISSIIWGSYSYKKTGVFAFANKLSSFNSLTLNHAYNKKFNDLYPQKSPDLLTEEISEKLPKNIFTNEWQVDSFYLNDSINYFKNNILDVFKGLLKKIYVILFYLNKDSQITSSDNIVKNDIRLSNIPNKIIFVIFLIKLISCFFNNKLNRENIFLMIVISFYFLPYLIGFIYTRHCTSMYMLACLHLTYTFFIRNEKFL
jgi:hypothetical protein